MIRAVAIAFFLVCTAGPVWAAEVEPFNPEAPFQQGLSTSLLRSLLNQAFDRLEDHIEFMTEIKGVGSLFSPQIERMDED